MRKLLPSLILFPALALPCTALAEIELGEAAGFDLAFAGMLQVDRYAYDADGQLLDGDAGDGRDHDQGIRRAELVLEADGEQVDWEIGYDVDDEEWLDVKLGWRFSQVQQITVGQFKQPDSLEELSSTSRNDFVSKAAITNAFAISRRLGVSWQFAQDTWSLTASAFGRELTEGGDRGNGFALRGGFAPLLTEDNILHLGVSLSRFDTDEHPLAFSSEPQADFAEDILGTAPLVDAEHFSRLGLESFWVHGPLKLQAEWTRGQVRRAGREEFVARGGYASAVWNLSGQSWSYKRSGLPDLDDGVGLWQIGLRYDRLDLDHAGIGGGRMQALTAGINWYPAEHFKLMLDYVAVDSERQGVSDNPAILAARAQLVW